MTKTRLNKTNAGDGMRGTMIAAVIVAVVLWLLRFMPFLLPHARLWGMNQLLFLPPALTYVYLAGGCLTLLMLIPAVRVAVTKIYISAAESLTERRPWLKLILFVVAAMVIFWLFRLPVKLLGDSQSLIVNMSGHTPVILKWSEAASIFVVYALSAILPSTGTDLGRQAYEIVSVVSGAGTILFIGGMAWHLADDSARRFFIYLIAIAAGWIVLFFGYTENYPLLWVFVSGYIYFAIRYIKGLSGLFWPTIFLVAAIAVHLQSLFFSLSYPVLIFSRGRAAQLYKQRKTFVWTTAAAVGIIAGVIAVVYYKTSFEFSHLIIPLFTGHPMTPDYWLFSPAHLLDIANEYLLLVPLLPTLIILGWRSPRSIASNTIDSFLGILTLGGVAFLLIIDPKLGMARDWDLYALAALPPLLMAARNIARKTAAQPYIYPVVIFVSALMVMPWVATNLSRQPAIDYFKYTLSLDSARSRTALVYLRQMYLDQGDSVTADSISSAMTRNFPAERLIQRAKDLIGQGRFAEAKTVVDSLESSDASRVEILTMRGYWNYYQGNIALALREMEEAAKLGKYAPEIQANLAAVYFSLHRYDQMIETLHRGLKRDPNSQDILVGLMAGYYQMKNYDSASVYARKLMKRYPDESDAHYISGMIALKQGRVEEARSFLKQYLELAPNGKYAERAKNELQALQR